MFYDVFTELCAQKGVSRNKALLAMGLSNSLAVKWRKTGATPVGVTLIKISNYFNVPVEELLIKSGKYPVPIWEKDGPESINIDAILDTMSDEELLDLLQRLTTKLAEKRRDK